MKQIIFRPAYLVLLLGGLLIIAAAIFAFSSKTAVPTGVIPTPPTILVERITLADAKTAYDSKSAIFLDVRAQDSYTANHIPGAINIPLQDLANRMGELDSNSWIITYCT